MLRDITGGKPCLEAPSMSDDIQDIMAAGRNTSRTNNSFCGLCLHAPRRTRSSLRSPETSSHPRRGHWGRRCSTGCLRENIDGELKLVQYYSSLSMIYQPIRLLIIKGSASSQHGAVSTVSSRRSPRRRRSSAGALKDIIKLIRSVICDVFGNA